MFIKQLQVYKEREAKKSIFEDTNIVGYLIMIRVLIENDKAALNIDEYFSIVKELIEKCLFTFEKQSLEVHITK